jgi:hypothetical protein
MSQLRDNRKLLAWAGACAAALETTRHIWKGFRGRTPPGWTRTSFVVPAAAITGAFLAGAFWLSRKRPDEFDRIVH